MINSLPNGLISWLNSVLHQSISKDDLIPLAIEASFRKFYRLPLKTISYVIMTSPPEKENNIQFIALAQFFKNKKINTPYVFEKNFSEGFFILEDFGDNLYNKAYQTDQKKCLSLAINTLHHLHSIPRSKDLPLYDALSLTKEMDLFDEWFLPSLPSKLQNIPSSYSEMKSLIIQNMIKQPYTCVHKDFHSRNLLYHKGDIAIIDFQDACWGPITYDLVSLLNDCYVEFTQEQKTYWIKTFLKKSNHDTLSFDEFYTFFNYTTLQRMIKICGIFSRLSKRDNKSKFLKYLPYILFILSSTSKSLFKSNEQKYFFDFYNWIDSIQDKVSQSK